MTMIPDDQARATIASIRSLSADDARQQIGEFIVGYSRLLHKVASTTSVDLEYDDKVQVGWIGIIKAVRRFDLGSSTRFASYAAWTAKREIQRAGRDCGRRVVRIPAWLQERARKVARAARLLGSPSVDVLAADLDLSPAAVETALESNHVIASLDAPIRDLEGVHPMVEAMASDFELEPEAGRVRAALAQLRSRHADVVRLVYGEDRSHQDAGAVLGVSGARVGQILGAAHAALRQSLGQTETAP